MWVLEVAINSAKSYGACFVNVAYYTTQEAAEKAAKEIIQFGWGMRNEDRTIVFFPTHRIDYVKTYKKDS